MIINCFSFNITSKPPDKDFWALANILSFGATKYQIVNICVVEWVWSQWLIYVEQKDYGMDKKLSRWPKTSSNLEPMIVLAGDSKTDPFFSLTLHFLSF